MTQNKFLVFAFDDIQPSHELFSVLLLILKLLYTLIFAIIFMNELLVHRIMCVVKKLTRSVTNYKLICIFLYTLGVYDGYLIIS